MPYISHCGSLPFGWSRQLHNGDTTAHILYQSCAKDPTHSACQGVPQPGDEGYWGLGFHAYKSCGILPSLDIPFLGKTLASKPVADAVRDHVNYCKTFYNNFPQGHSRTCDFVGVQRLHATLSAPPH